MTYLYYKTSTYTGNQKPNEKTIDQWKHLAEKKNWRITQLPNVSTKQSAKIPIMRRIGTMLHVEKL